MEAGVGVDGWGCSTEECSAEKGLGELILSRLEQWNCGDG
jgi:hypothetical protein